jgi:hypothetical protein
MGNAANVWQNGERATDEPSGWKLDWDTRKADIFLTNSARDHNTHLLSFRY